MFAHDLTVKGDVETQGDVRVEGQLHGNLTGGGLVTIAEQGEVHGNVEGREVIVLGRVEGNVKGSAKVGDPREGGAVSMDMFMTA